MQLGIQFYPHYLVFLITLVPKWSSPGQEKKSGSVSEFSIKIPEKNTGYRTDVAFDDVQLVPGRCRDLTSMKELPPLPSQITNRSGYSNSDLNQIDINIMVDSSKPRAAFFERATRPISESNVDIPRGYKYQ